MKRQQNVSAAGTNKSLDSILERIEKRRLFDINATHRQYALYKEMMDNDPTPEMIDQFCKKYHMIKHKFINGYKELVVMSEDEAIDYVNEKYRRCASSAKYGYVKRIVNKDNQKGVYNRGNGCGYCTSIRVPSLKRNNAVWKRFYDMFPEMKGREKYNGAKLKKI